ncbi:FAD-binding oxidoreductase [candidate division KSB1 bacterium]|nr:FAD-binding oxidoreductase [candidate division KSB1 bacterium]
MHYDNLYFEINQRIFFGVNLLANSDIFIYVFSIQHSAGPMQNTKTEIKKADVVIIGAGVIGCSIAYYLCKCGITDVVMIEKEAFPGSGSTSRANGGIRAQFTTEANIQMSLLSMDLLDAMDEEMRSQSGYTKAGYLFLTAEKNNLRQLEKNIKFQKGLGVSVEFISKEEIKTQYPYIRCDDLLGGSFGSRDGFIDSGGLTNAYYSQALSMGAKMLKNTHVTGLTISNDCVKGVHTSDGKIKAEWVVNAAGPFAANVAQWAKIDLPVQPCRRNIFMTGPTPDLPAIIPMTVDMDTGLLARREGKGISLAGSNPDDTQGFESSFDHDFIEWIAPKMEKRFPQLEEAGIDFSKCWAGLYPETPDHHAILGESGVGGFLLATGLGGHGIMHAPAVGYLMSELVEKGKVESLNFSAFELTRFEKGLANVEKAVL